MKIYGFVLLTFFYSFFAFGSAKFKELGSQPEAFESSFDFYGSSLTVVQKRLIPKKFMSEFSLGISPIIKGFEYINSYSVHIDYRFFLNEFWSFNLKYLWHFNNITEEGKYEIEKVGYIPLDLKYPQKQSYFGGMEWYPFYGKAVLYNYLLRFDLYVSLLGGVVELINLDKKIPVGSVGLGLVFWLNRYFNARLELKGSYYRYEIFDSVDSYRKINEYSYKVYLSSGVLF